MIEVCSDFLDIWDYPIVELIIGAITDQIAYLHIGLITAKENALITTCFTKQVKLESGANLETRFNHTRFSYEHSNFSR